MTYLMVKNTRTFSGRVVPPSSKSQSIRGMILALLSEGESLLLNPLDSDDMQDAMKVCEALGAQLTVHKDRLVVRGGGIPIKSRVHQIYTSNSGITTRFVMPLLGLREDFNTPMVIDCGEQMRVRPIQALVNALRKLGLTIDYLEQEGKLPVAVSGQLKGGTTEVDGITSQYLSALLLSLPCAPNYSEITVKKLNERPYMEMTLNWLKQQNIQCSHRQEDEYDIYQIPGNQRYQAFQTVIAGDFSSASYLIIAAVMLPGRVKLNGLDMQDPQGDKRLIDLLQEMGADIQITSQGLVIEGERPLQGIEIDANDIPDLLPALAIIGTYAEGKTKITNVPQARIKETDRIHSMVEGLSILEANVEEYPDGMTIYQSKLKGARVKGYNDHRTVMALAVAGMLAEGVTLIDNAESINKTFPTFVHLMQSLGAKMEITDDLPS